MIRGGGWFCFSLGAWVWVVSLKDNGWLGVRATGCRKELVCCFGEERQESKREYSDCDLAKGERKLVVGKFFVLRCEVRWWCI